MCVCPVVSQRKITGGGALSRMYTGDFITNTVVLLLKPNEEEDADNMKGFSGLVHC